MLGTNYIKRNEIDCHYINNKCMQECKCYKENNTNDIIRIFQNYELYEWEKEVYKELINSKIIANINIGEYVICYNLNEYISMRKFLNKENNKNTSLILNELYSFINMFKKYNFVHGNLHIDNIFIKIENNHVNFKVIDYVNSYITNNKKKDILKKTSFIGEYEKKEYNNFLLYWDFFTMYISLKTFYKNKIKIIYNLQNIVESYIPHNIFNNILQEIIIKNKMT